MGAGFSACFLALAWSDLRRIIPNRIVYPALVLALAASGVWPDRGFAEALAGGLGALATAMAARGLSGGGLGGGDVKMAAQMGAVRLRGLPATCWVTATVVCTLGVSSPHVVCAPQFGARQGFESDVDLHHPAASGSTLLSGWCLRASRLYAA